MEKRVYWLRIVIAISALTCIGIMIYMVSAVSNSLKDFSETDVILLCATMAGTTTLCSLLFQALIEIYRIESEINQEKRYETIRG